MDDKDRVVGTTTLGECLERGLIHRAVDVIVRRSDGRILMQRRNKKDLWHPGLWTLSSTGHVKKGESYAAAARRELSEELGLHGKLRLHSKVQLPTLRSRGMTEREWVSIYTTETDGDLNIDPTEVDSAEPFTPSELRALLSSRLLTPDARIILRLYLGQKQVPVRASRNRTR